MMFEWRSPKDDHNFKVGMSVEFRPYTWRELLFDRYLWVDRWHSITRWWRPRFYTSAIDIERGEITIKAMRWSWRRWRWEAMP